MKHITTFPAVSFAALITISFNVFGASFVCNQASTAVERMICNSPELSKLDDELAKAYKNTANEKGYGFAQNFQHQWLKSRNRCKDEDCLSEAYESRLRELNRELLDSHDFITGDYSFGKGDGYQGHGYIVKLTENRFRYELYVTSGKPAWHTGGAAGEAVFESKGIARTIPSTSTCRLGFKIEDEKVSVSHLPGGKPGDCEMGARVSMNVTYFRN